MAKKRLNASQKKEYMEGVKTFKKRINFEGDTYYTIFNEAQVGCLIHKIISYEREIKKSKEKTSKHWLKLVIEQEKEYMHQRKNYFVAVAFAAMFLESVIWDYAAMNTSQNLTEEHLSKLDFVGKWKVVPKLINGKNANIGSKAIELLKKLNKERNRIVHSKSKPIPNSYDNYMKYVNRSPNFTIDNVIECIKECIKGLEKLDTTSYWFLDTETVKEDIPELNYIDHL